MPRQSTKVPRVCKTCGSSFSVIPSRLKYGAALHCSRECQRAHNRTPRTCARCNTEFLAETRHVLSGKALFCSIACSNIAKQPDIHDRFWRKVDQNGPVNRPEIGPCWPWTGRRDAFGYGTIYRTFPNRVRASHVAWEIATDESLIEGELIGHICDNPPCVRNDSEGFYEVKGVLLSRRGHLFKGTDADNARDMSAKGRGRSGTKTGSENAQARLTESLVIEIRRLYATGTMTQDALASQFGVSHGTIWNVVHRKRWLHVT